MSKRRFLITCICLIPLLPLPPAPQLPFAPTPVLAEGVSFKLDVMPVFFRAGCNSGSCHGAASGKDGFRLSLFGYDPDGDYYRLTQELVGRRIDLAVPQRSLLLEKSIGKVKHTGGKRFDTESKYYQTLLAWIEQGAAADVDDLPQVERIELVPDKIVFNGEGAQQQGVVQAHYSDGTMRDVTDLALYLAGNESIANIDEQGVVHAVQRGGAHVFARFDKFTVGAEVIVLPRESDFVWPNPPAHNELDRLVYDKLQLLQLAPSELCSDEQFVRRAYIDLIGLLPTVEEYHRFMESGDPQKRLALVDALLRREEFADLWAAKWGEALRIKGDTNPGSGTALKAAWNYYHWIRDQIRDNVPVDQFVRAMIRGTGSNFRDPASNYYNMLSQGHIDAQKVSEDTAQLFLGIRTQCAQCHNHPFDRWTVDDYYSWMSFFTGVRRKHGAEAREFYVYNDDSATPAKHLVDGRDMPPAFLGGGPADTGGRDPRRVLAAWITTPDNRLFRRNIANRVWAHFFGRGIVEPVDDFRISNQPCNAELLEELGRRLAEDYQFDVKKLIRDICNSRTYQLSCTTNETNRNDVRYFSHAYIRRVRADVLLDNIAQATSVRLPFRRSTSNRAVTLYQGFYGDDFNRYFLTTFGQAKRETVCACEDNSEATLSQALHMLNGDTVNRKAIGESKVIAERMASGTTDQAIVAELYVRTLTRTPTPHELRSVSIVLDAAQDDRQRRESLEDLLWALLNSEEFLFNH